MSLQREILAFAGEALFKVYELFVVGTILGGGNGNSRGRNKRITKIFVFTTCEVSFFRKLPGIDLPFAKFCLR